MRYLCLIMRQFHYLSCRAEQVQRCGNPTLPLSEATLSAASGARGGDRHTASIHAMTRAWVRSHSSRSLLSSPPPSETAPMSVEATPMSGGALHMSAAGDVSLIGDEPRASAAMVLTIVAPEPPEVPGSRGDAAETSAGGAIRGCRGDQVQEEGAGERSGGSSVSRSSTPETGGAVRLPSLFGSSIYDAESPEDRYRAPQLLHRTRFAGMPSCPCCTTVYYTRASMAWNRPSISLWCYPYLARTNADLGSVKLG